MSPAKRTKPVRRKRPVTSFTLTRDAIKQLRAVVRALGVSRSAVVEMLVRRFSRELIPDAGGGLPMKPRRRAKQGAGDAGRVEAR